MYARCVGVRSRASVSRLTLQAQGRDLSTLQETIDSAIKVRLTEHGSRKSLSTAPATATLITFLKQYPSLSTKISLAGTYFTTIQVSRLEIKRRPSTSVRPMHLRVPLQEGSCTPEPMPGGVHAIEVMNHLRTVNHAYG